MKMSLFQIILLFVFGIIAIVAVIIFANYAGTKGTAYLGQVDMWGTVPSQEVLPLISKLNQDNAGTFTLVYSEKNSATFENDLLSALAAGDGPDIFVLPSSQIVKESDKISLVPFSAISSRQFNDAFIDESSLFLINDGILALPLYVDPLVMYWNKDILSSSGVPTYPKTWGDLLNITSKITVANRIGNISQATVGLGEYSNVDYAKYIISTLLMQGGDKIVTTETDNSQDANKPFRLAEVFGTDHSIAESAVRFYNSFSNPANDSYAWNSELPESRNAFQSGTLALYMGLASDYNKIKMTNPHLNFDVAKMPQRDTAETKITYGELYGLAITKVSKNFNAALAAEEALVGTTYSSAWSQAIFLPSARRDVLSHGTADPTMSVFYDSALISHGWLDPSPRETDNIFRDMIGGVLSGAKIEGEVVDSARKQLSILVDNFNGSTIK